jgi:hypothetical protein
MISKKYAKYKMLGAKARWYMIPFVEEIILTVSELLDKYSSFIISELNLLDYYFVNSLNLKFIRLKFD